MRDTQTHSSCPELNDDREALRHLYEDKRLGAHEIARRLGCSASAVLYRLRKHGIPVRQQRVSRHAECDGSWLAEHYLDRAPYVAWCHEHGIEPEDEGGHGLSTAACADEARVSRETIRRWLVQHGIERRRSDDSPTRRSQQRHLFALGRHAGAALRRFEAADVVRAIEVRENEIIRVEYVTGITERWALGKESDDRLRWPDHGWWTRQRRVVDAHQGFLGEDDAQTSGTVNGLPCTAKCYATLGFLDQRLLVAEVVRDLTTEGWRRPEFTNEELEDDLRAVLDGGTVHAPTPGYLRGQPGRPPSGVPAGMRLALDLVDWGPLSRPGGMTLAEAWCDPQRIYWAVESSLRRGDGITREGIAHRLCVGSAEGVARRAGPLWRPPGYWISLLRDVLGFDHRPIVFDATPTSGSKAVAVASLGGIYVHPSQFAIRHDGPLWNPRGGKSDGPEIDADDHGPAEVALVDCADLPSFEAAIERYRGQCDRIVTRLPWSAREGVRELGARVVRLRARPYKPDEIIAIWS